MKTPVFASTVNVYVIRHKPFLCSGDSVPPGRRKVLNTLILANVPIINTYNTSKHNITCQKKFIEDNVVFSEII